MNWEVPEKCTVWHFPLLHYSGTNIHVGPIILLSRESFCIPLKPLNGDNNYLIIKGQGRGNTSVFSLCSIFLKKYLFIWLHWVLAAAFRILVVAHTLSSCGVRNPRACGIWDSWPQVEPMSPILQGRFLTAGPPGTSCLGSLCWEEMYVCGKHRSPLRCHLSLSFPKCL